MILTSTLFLFGFGVAWAQEPSHIQHNLGREAKSRSFVELRGGVAASPSGPSPAQICGELSPLDGVGIESCGNGAGTLHHAPIPDFFHIRARARVMNRSLGASRLSLVVGVGIAEVTATADSMGLRFGERPAGEIEAAGTEVSLSTRFQRPLPAQFKLVADLNVGVAHIPGAPAVLQQGGTALPFGGLTIGLAY